MDTMTAKKARRLLDIRAELGLKQTDIAREANLSQWVISTIEQGELISELKALQVFHAVNRLRAARDWPALEFDEIRWNLRPNTAIHSEGDDQ